ncbi:MAG TPA: hypothetical protein VOB72_14200 [Candidatus Dormibacteraeota bacterium]|nr:hypothetical protein [Candidatus Dormibacteraeota bacterium]
MPLSPEVLSAAAAALGARGVEPVADLTTSGRATVARLRVTGGDVETAVLKLGGDHVMANWCGLAFLDHVAPGAGPRLLAADRRFVVMEDLGAGPSLKSVLAGDDPAAAEAALVAHASALGRLAAATRGRRNEYARLVRELGGDESLLAPVPSERMVLDAWAAAERELPALGLRVSPAAARDVERLRALWAVPHAALSFSPGDTCPDNHVLTHDGSARFFDVDFCSFHPTAFDAAYHARPRFPTCNYLLELPEPAAARARAAYASCVPVDGAEVDEAVVAWTAWNAGEALATLLRRDRRLGPTSFRQMLLWRLGATAERCEELDAMRGLGTLLGELAEALAGRWPEIGPMPLYPAFRGQG